MKKEIISKWLLILSIPLLVASCARTKNSIPIALLDVEQASNLSCAQLYEGITYINSHGAAGSNIFGGGTLSSGLALGGVATFPLLFVGGLLDARNDRKALEKKHSLLDLLIANYDKRDCAEYQAEPLYRGDLSDSENGSFKAKPMESLEYPSSCNFAIDKEKRTYVIDTRGIEKDEYLKFYTVGNNTKNIKMKASHLMYGEVKLPKFSLTSRRGGGTRGLWVSRLKNKDKMQLNYLPASQKCNSKGEVSVEYRNIWVMAQW